MFSGVTLGFVDVSLIRTIAIASTTKVRHVEDNWLIQ